MKRNSRGQTVLEFAIVAWLFFSIVLAIADIAVMFYVNLTMQNAVREGTRYAVTGLSNLGADRRSAMIQKIKDSSNGLYDKNLYTPKDPTIKVIDPTQVSYANYSSGTLQPGNPGQPNQIIEVSLTYTWPLLTPFLKPFFPGGKYTFTVKSTMKNEPFPVPGGP